MVLSAERRKELFIRTFSGLTVAAVVLGAIIYGEWAWGVVVTVIAGTSLVEFYRLAGRRLKVSPGIGLIAGVIVLLGVGLADMGARAILVSLGVTFFMTMTFEILRRQNSEVSTALENGAGIMAGFVYVVLPWSFAILLRSAPAGKILLLTVFLCTWTCDVFAYLVGTAWGRHKICDQVSPKKTWEGFLSGLAGSFLAASLMAYLRRFPPFPLLVIAIICGIVGQVGDLAESILKREVSVKDSGNVLPGHGGMLDRFDSVLFSLTVVYLLFEVIWR
ncbi:MAG: phosphatidate cytidylyltransferase [Dethiosulfovibrio peptidovorans]|nr:MAG: phosphatidate cytidylyltransferase [Dethiosulfovibrio peptidovorans]